MNYFDATVQVMVESQDGKGNPLFKRVKKSYLVDALTVTEAEARVVKVFEEMGGVKEYSVLAVNGSRVMSTILVEGDTYADQNFYEVIVEIKLESSNRVKRIKETYLIESTSITEAEKKVINSFEKEGFTSDYEVVLIKKSKVCEIVFTDTKELKELPEGKFVKKEAVEEEQSSGASTWTPVGEQKLQEDEPKFKL
jgi:hypothetical protein